MALVYVVNATTISGQTEIEHETRVFFQRHSAVRNFLELAGDLEYVEQGAAMVARGKRKLVEMQPVNIPDQRKVSQGTIDEIVRRYRAGEASQAELAKEYGVSQAAVSAYVRGYRRAKE